MTTLLLDNTAANTATRNATGTGSALHSVRERLAAIYKSVLVARERRAKRMVDGYLASLNDETLIDLGLDPAAVRHPQADPLVRFYL